MEEPDYATELESIRSAYTNSMPRQRLHVIQQRLAHPSHGPNTLVTRVSAVEAFSRSLVLHELRKPDQRPQANYARLRNIDPDKLVTLYLGHRGLGPAPLVFGEVAWRRFGFAISYRNLLVHECTYLGQDKYPLLEEACDQVLSKLVELAGLPVGSNNSSKPTPLAGAA